MKILHVTPHLGGGVGTVIMDWMEKIKCKNNIVICLDYVNKKGLEFEKRNNTFILSPANSVEPRSWITEAIAAADIVLVHYWDHPLLADLFSRPILDCRLVFWCHKNYDIPNKDERW